MANVDDYLRRLSTLHRIHNSLPACGIFRMLYKGPGDAPPAKKCPFFLRDPDDHISCDSLVPPDTGGFKGGQGGHAPQDARGDEVSPEHI